MVRELVPELHDIGKLIDNEILGKEIAEFKNAGHTFENIDLSKLGLPAPTTLTWLGVIGHHLLGSKTVITSPPSRLQKYPFEAVAEVALLKISDEFACSTSRVLEKETKEKLAASAKAGQPEILRDSGQKPIPAAKSVQKIWNSESEKLSIKLIRNKDDLRAMLSFLADDPTKEEFYRQYGDVLELRPEDEIMPLAVTSLKTHVDLVGKAYRILKGCIVIDSDRRLLKYQNETTVKVQEAQQWTFRLARCNITFPQYPIRAHDLGVFLRLNELMQKMESDDHVLMHTLDSLWLFLPVEGVFPLKDPLKPFLDAGFIIKTDVAEKPLKDLDSKIFGSEGEKVDHFNLYPDMLSEFSPHICELCQMRPSSSQPVTDEKSGIIENLCEVCKGFRKLSKDRSTFKKLGDEWEQLNVPVAWVRVSLDYKCLHGVLTRLFKTYLRKKIESIPVEEIEALASELRYTALMADFTNDYRKLLSAFSRRIKQDMDAEDIGGEHPELLVVALKEKGQALKIADIFIEEFCKVFPDCEANSPVFLSISISNAKYPFFEHWRFLDKPEDEARNAINIQAVNRACLEFSIPKFRKLRDLSPEKASSKLHRAVAVGSRTGSELMAKIDFLDDLQRYPTLHKAHIEHGFSIDELLNYHKIADIGGES